MRDDEDFHEFVQVRAAALSRTAYLLTGDHQLAEDLVQIALARAALRWRRVVEGGNPEGYVRRVMLNERTSWWRRRRFVEVSSAAMTDERPRSVDESEAVVSRVALRRALATLPPRQRAVLVLRFFEDLTEAQTAELMGCSIGTVKSQGHLALTRLRTLVPHLLADEHLEVSP